MDTIMIIACSLIGLYIMLDIVCLFTYRKRITKFVGLYIDKCERDYRNGKYNYSKDIDEACIQELYNMVFSMPSDYIKNKKKLNKKLGKLQSFIEADNEKGDTDADD